MRLREKIDYQNLLKYLLVVPLIVILYVIVWHIYNGYFVGWKSLADTRIAFTFFTVIFFIYNKIHNKENNLTFIIYSSILLLILIFSGERKAIAIFIFLFILNYFRGLGIKSLLILFIIYFSFSMSTSYISNPYIKDKFDTTLNIMNTGNFNYVLQTGTISEEDTFSNAQRAFSIDISKKLFVENPLFGIGTNNYINFVNRNYSFLPEFMRLGIHGEFQRILIENGIFGLILYLFVWFKSLSRFKSQLRSLIDIKLLSYNQSRFILYSIYLSTLFYVGTEASSLRSFILLGIISILPDLVQNFIIKYKSYMKIN